MILSKKSVLSVSLFVLILWGAVLSTFANPPTSPYGVSQNITDPACPPGGTNCYVASVSIGDTIGNNPDQNGILYTDASGQITTDDLFTRDSVTKDTIIGKDFNISIDQFDLVTSNIIGLGSFSAPFNDGDQIEGVTSGATATIEHSEGGLFYISNLSGTFQNGESVNNTTSGETAVVNQLYPINSFSPGDTFIVFDPTTSQTVGTGIVTGVTGSGFTVSMTSGVLNLYYLIFDQPGNGMSKIFGITDGGPAAPSSVTTHGQIQVGSLLGGLVQGMGFSYRSDDANKFAVSFVGSAFGGGDTYSAGTLIGNIALNNYSSIIQNLTGLGGSPSIEMGTVDAMNNHNTNVLLNRSRIVLQANQEIALLAGRIQIGQFDYNNDTEYDPFPAFSTYYYLPQARGSAGQVLTDDGSGNTYWATPAGSTSLIGSTSSAGNETWLGQNAGGNGGSSSNTVFLGIQAGYTATNAYYSNFIGYDAGREASNASNSNFFGNSAGYGATDASRSNFLGYSAGYQATNASYSNFFGENSGYQATNASYSNFLGYSAGYIATNASNSNIFGQYAGYDATNASHSNFLGYNAGYTATNASNSNIFGQYAGYGATNASNSNFFGNNAGSGATDAFQSNFFGTQAGINATGASNSNIFGQYAGYGATTANNSNFFGNSAGYSATDASYSNFFGTEAGINATGASNSNFFGNSAGYIATNASHSNFLGYNAGKNATNASNSNFFGENSGYQATNASYSNFLGAGAGADATNASNSNFFGQNAGASATNASQSIFIGLAAGNNDLVNNTGSGDDYSILIGNWSSTGDNGSGVGYSNSIALGAYATNTASNQFMIGSTTRPIDTLVLTGSGGNTCVLDVTVASPSCSSDETLKTNITDLSPTTLENLLKVKTVSYDWKNYPKKGSQIGFLAQDLEQYFPEVVSTAPNGFKTVSYGGMTPILVEAMREMDLKITNITNPTEESSIVDKIIAKLIKADRVETKELCVDDVCVTRDQFLRILESSGQTPSKPSTERLTTTPDEAPAPDQLTCTEPQVLNEEGDTCIDPVTETPSVETAIPEPPSAEEPSVPTE